MVEAIVSLADLAQQLEQYQRNALAAAGQYDRGQLAKDWLACLP